MAKKRAGAERVKLFLFPSIVLTVLENDAAQGKTCKATEYKLSKAMIQNHHYSTHALPPVWMALVSTVRVVLPVAEGLSARAPTQRSSNQISAFTLKDHPFHRLSLTVVKHKLYG